MAFDYSRARATAQRMIANYGGPGTLKRTTVGSGGTAFEPVEEVTEYPCTAVVVPVRLRDRAGTLIEDATSTAYVAAQGLAIVPTTQDRLTWNGRDYVIAEAMPLDPSGAAAVLYELRLRD